MLSLKMASSRHVCQQNHAPVSLFWNFNKTINNYMHLLQYLLLFYVYHIILKTACMQSMSWPSSSELQIFLTKLFLIWPVYLGEILEVRQGFKTDVFNKVEAKVGKKKQKHGNKFTEIIDENLSFSIIYGKRKETLDLVAPDQETCNKWVRNENCKCEKNFTLIMFVNILSNEILMSISFA